MATASRRAPELGGGSSMLRSIAGTGSEGGWRGRPSAPAEGLELNADDSTLPQAGTPWHTDGVMVGLNLVPTYIIWGLRGLSHTHTLSHRPGTLMG